VLLKIHFCVAHFDCGPVLLHIFFADYGGLTNLRDEMNMLSKLIVNFGWFGFAGGCAIATR